MKPLTPFRQTPGFCGPASLKILLSHYGIEKSEQELANLCESTPENGTDHAGLVKAAKALGAVVSVKENATIDDLRTHVENDIPVIVGWWSTFGREGDHFSVVYEVGKTKIYLMDPETSSGIRIMPIEDFEKNWHDFDGPDNHPVQRWMMTLAFL